jgi:sugar lactone lactonase YvrE
MRSPRNGFMATLIALCGCSSEKVTQPEPPPNPGSGPHFVLSFSDDNWGGSGSSLAGLASDRNGNIWLTHHGSYGHSLYTSDIFSYDPDGNSLGAWNSVSVGGALALGNDGSVFVVDTGQDILVKVATSGQEEVHWGSDSGAPGWFGYPLDIATNNVGMMWVIDSGGQRVEVFAADGDFEREWFVPLPWRIAIDPQGNVYVSSVDTFALRKYTPTGDFLSFLNTPFVASSLDAGEDGYIYIGGSDGQFAKLSSSGELVIQWQGNGFHYLAVGPDSSIFALQNSRPYIAKYSSTGNLLETFEGTDGSSLLVDGAGDVYIGTSKGPPSYPPPYYANVTRFSSSGQLLETWGQYGTSEGELRNPAGMAFSPDSSLLIVDAGNRRVERFTRDGMYLSKFGNDPTLDGKFQAASDIDLDSRGNVLVADAGNNRIQKFTAEGLLLLKWGAPGPEPGQFNSPRGIAIDDADQIYVWDTGNGRVQVFDDEGAFLRAWPAADSTGALVPSSSGLVGIDADQEGYIYLVDSGGNRVVKFMADGTPLGCWGALGTGPGEFQSPRNIAIDPDRNIYVTDMGNSRVQKFSY